MKTILLLILILNFGICCVAQSNQQLPISLSTKDCKRLHSRINKRFEKATSHLKSVNDKHLRAFWKLEESIITELCAVNELQAESQFKSSLQSYRRYQERLEMSSGRGLKNHYPGFDSLSCALTYFESTYAKGSEPSKSSDCSCSDAHHVKSSQNLLRAEIMRSEVIQEYIRDRTQYLSRIANSSQVPSGALKKLIQSNYYLGESISNRISILNKRSKIENRIFRLLNTNQGFKDFVNSNGQLASLNNSSLPSNEIHSKIKIEDLLANAQKSASTTIARENEKMKSLLNSQKEKSNIALSYIDTLRNLEKDTTVQKIWKPNPYKSKRFIQRLQYGIDFQATQRTNFVPSAGVISGSISYNFSQNVSLGINTGLITSIQSLNFSREFTAPTVSNDGITLGLLVDSRLRNRIFITGGAEVNNRNLTNQEETSTASAVQFKETYWNLSALTGIKLKLPSGRNKEQTLSIVYDFLHTRSGLPPVSIRMGMNFLPKH